MSAVASPAEQRFVLHDVPWRTYRRLLRALTDRPGVRLTFDRGTLELMTLSHEHESRSYLLARLVDALTEELDLPVKGGRSTTFRRRKKLRGLEPDSCWWIANEALVRGKTKIDLRIDPPPDLSLEIDLTHSSLDRLAIYEALKIPEVWRVEDQNIISYLLNAGHYTVSAVSRAFPGLTVSDLASFLNLSGQMDDNAIVRQFRAWARKQFPQSNRPPAPP
jgi:Uma2 family endonuclease